MTNLRQIYVGVLTAVVSISMAAVSQAQIFEAPTPQPNALVQQAGGQVAASQPGQVKQTAWSGIPMPKFTMPKMTMPKLAMPTMQMPSMESVVGPVKSSFSKVTAGTKKAWEGTREIFTFGQNKSVAASAQKKPSMWRRLLTPAPKPDGPQTVAEWMAQPRLDP